jgi:hypothetical protein
MEAMLVLFESGRVGCVVRRVNQLSDRWADAAPVEPMEARLIYLRSELLGLETVTPPPSVRPSKGSQQLGSFPSWDLQHAVARDPTPLIQDAGLLSG